MMRGREPVALARMSVHPKHHRKRILLAEDDRELRTLLAGALARDGREIVQAADGAELVSQLANAYMRPSARFDLVITDHRMPGIAGLDVLRWLRFSRIRPPVILMTAFGGTEMRAIARGLGSAAVFDKPFQVDDLRTAVEFVFSPAFAKLERQKGGSVD